MLRLTKTIATETGIFVSPAVSRSTAFSLSGSEATFGQETHNAIMVAIDEINAAGGLNGRKIRILTEDTQSKPEEAANAVTKLITQSSVVAMLGEVASSSSIAGGAICQASKVPMITPS